MLAPKCSAPLRGRTGRIQDCPAAHRQAGLPPATAAPTCLVGPAIPSSPTTTRSSVGIVSSGSFFRIRFVVVLSVLSVDRPRFASERSRVAVVRRYFLFRQPVEVITPEPSPCSSSSAAHRRPRHESGKTSVFRRRRSCGPGRQRVGARLVAPGSAGQTGTEWTAGCIFAFTPNGHGPIIAGRVRRADARRVRLIEPHASETQARVERAFSALLGLPEDRPPLRRTNTVALKARSVCNHRPGTNHQPAGLTPARLL